VAASTLQESVGWEANVSVCSKLANPARGAKILMLNLRPGSATHVGKLLKRSGVGGLEVAHPEGGHHAASTTRVIQLTKLKVDHEQRKVVGAELAVRGFFCVHVGKGIENERVRERSKSG
jgi:hypothetical protein